MNKKRFSIGDEIIARNKNDFGEFDSLPAVIYDIEGNSLKCFHISLEHVWNCCYPADWCRKTGIQYEISWLNNINQDGNRTIQSWIPIKWRKITEEKRDGARYFIDYKICFDCEMPEDGQEILVLIKEYNELSGEYEYYVRYDVHTDYFLGLECDECNWGKKVIGWMPIPTSFPIPAYEPYLIHVNYPSPKGSGFPSMPTKGSSLQETTYP